MKQRIILLFLLLTSTFSGCTNLLDITPQGELTTATFFTTPASAKQGLVAAYKFLQSNYRWNYPGYVRWVFGDICSDDAEKGGESGGDSPEMLQIEYFAATATNPFTENAWSILYQGVSAANQVIIKAPKVPGLDQATKDLYVAEGQFLRAYYYFNLALVFGGVPLVVTDELKDYNIPRDTKEAVYAQIEKDLLAAIPKLPLKSEQDTDDYGRITKGAAQALLARVYMMQGDLVKTEVITKAIIDSKEYSLEPEYYRQFTVDGEHGPESIFEVNFQYDPLYTGGHGSGDGDARARGSRATYGWGFDCPTADLAAAFEPGDPRKKATMYATGDILPDGTTADVGNSPTGYLCTKFILLKNEMPPSSSSSPKDQIIFRLGMILLWYAEAANENGHTQEALNALNSVRKRAREGNEQILQDITTTEKIALRQAIWKEQRVEYATEALRFFDLVRTNRAETVLHAYAKKYNSTKGKNYQKGVNEVFPVPQSQIDLSQGVLKQNNGYH